MNPPPSRPPPKLPKISVVNKSRNEEEAFELRSHLEEIPILVSMSLSPINLKCWILQNVILYFVCEIMLKLCVLNVKTRLLYYKAKLMLVLNVNTYTQIYVYGPMITDICVCSRVWSHFDHISQKMNVT